MRFEKSVAGLALAAAIAMPGGARAQVGVPGCTNLPDYNRALGALQGMTSACDMSVERARRIIAEHDGVAPEPTQAAPDTGHRRHRARAPQP